MIEIAKDNTHWVKASDVKDLTPGMRCRVTADFRGGIHGRTGAVIDAYEDTVRVNFDDKNPDEWGAIFNDNKEAKPYHCFVAYRHEVEVML